MKYSYSEAEIEDFKRFMRIVRRIPRENYLKLIDRWRKHSSVQERLLHEVVDLLSSRAYWRDDLEMKRVYLLREIDKVLRKDMI